MTLSDRQWEFLQDFAKLIAFAESNGFKLTGGELYRTAEQQAIYFANGLSKKDRSLHQDRLAIDLNFFHGDDLLTDRATLQKLGDHWESLSEYNMWGGNYPKYLHTTFYDAPHFERRMALRPGVRG
uniref:Putative peptidase n=1 Tax=viral metagenome TaxID=1070528 RepID=A0A6M3KXV9_9ZZZZ